MRRPRDPAPCPLSAVLILFFLPIVLLAVPGCSGSECLDTVMDLTADCGDDDATSGGGDDDGTFTSPTPKPSSAPKGVISLASADARFGWAPASDQGLLAIAAAGDVNGDGYGDIIVGANLDNTVASSAGAAYLLSGPLYGKLDASSATAKFLGEAESDWAGYSVASAGDMNGDGYGDLIIGAPHNSQFLGAAYVVLGPASGTQHLSSAYMKLVGVEDFGIAGSIVAPAGNAGGTGTSGIFVNGSLSDENYHQTGLVYVVTTVSAGTVPLSLAQALITNETKDEGASPASAGDVNGDGYEDILIGATGSDAGGESAGAVYLLHGPVSGSASLSNAAAVLVGENANEYAGATVSSAGDVNGDGFADVLVGTRAEQGQSVFAAYLLYGPLDGTMSLSEADVRFTLHDETGVWYSVSGAGDVNGDGYDDVLIGAPKSSKAFLVYGPITSGYYDLANADATFEAEEGTLVAGVAVSSAGDVNGDGYADILIGAYGDSATYGEAPAVVYVVYGGHM